MEQWNFRAKKELYFNILFLNQKSQSSLHSLGSTSAAVTLPPKTIQQDKSTLKS